MAGQEKDIFRVAESYEKKKDPIKYQEFAEYYQDDKSDGTIVQYLRYLPYLDFNPLADEPEPSETDIENFSLSDFKHWATLKANKQDCDTDRFRYNIYLALKNYLKAMGEKEKLSELPASREIPKPSSKSPKTRYTEEDIQDMLDTISADEKVYQAILHMFYSGMRTYEILHIKPDWYSFSEEAIEIEIPAEYAKGKKNSKEPEYCFLPTRFEDEIKDYIVNQYKEVEDYGSLIDNLSESLEHMFEFIEDSDKDFKALARERYHLNKELQKIAQKAGISMAEEISAHRLRKSFVHHIYEGENGLNLSRTSRLARHENTDLTDKHYLNIEKQESKQDYQKVMG